MITGGGGGGYTISPNMTRVAAATQGPSVDDSFYDVLADYSKRIGTSATLEGAVNEARELSRGAARPGIAVMPDGDAFALFPAQVVDASYERPSGATMLEGSRELAKTRFHAPQLAALVDGETAITSFDRDTTPMRQELGPLGLIYRRASERPFSYWRADASRVELGFGHGSLADATAAAARLSAGDQAAVAVLEANGWYHLHRLEQTTRTSPAKPGGEPIVEGPSPLHLDAEFASRPYLDNTTSWRRLSALVDGDVALGATRTAGGEYRFQPLPRA